MCVSHRWGKIISLFSFPVNYNGDKLSATVFFSVKQTKSVLPLGECKLSRLCWTFNRRIYKEYIGCVTQSGFIHHNPALPNETLHQWEHHPITTLPNFTAMNVFIWPRCVLAPVSSATGQISTARVFPFEICVQLWIITTSPFVKLHPV